MQTYIVIEEHIRGVSKGRGLTGAIKLPCPPFSYHLENLMSIRKKLYDEERHTIKTAATTVATTKGAL